MTNHYEKIRKALAHEIWAAAQLAPGEGIVDGVARIASLLRKAAYPVIIHCAAPQRPAARPPKPTECMNGCPDRQVCDHCQWPPGPDQQPASTRFGCKQPAAAELRQDAEQALVEPTCKRSLQVAGQLGPEHISSPECWCHPVPGYKDPETGAEVWVHRSMR